MLIAAPAGATIQRSSWTNYARGTTCTVYAQLDQYGNSFRAGGQVPCSTRYAETGLYVALQWWNGSLGRWITVQQASTVFSNSYGTGDHTLWSPYYTQAGHGCVYWRAEAQAQINYDPGYVTLFTQYQEHCQ